MKTYALTLDNGKISYVPAKRRSQAVAVWNRRNNEKIVKIKIVTDLMADACP